MKIRVLSDLHIDISRPSAPPDLGEDVVILAGDLAESLAGLEWAVASFPRPRLIFVLGNHEFYGGDIHAFVSDYRDAAARLAGERITVLERGATVIGGIRFIGTTLWTDYELYGATPQAVGAAMTAARRNMLDYRHIHVGQAESRLLTPEDTVVLHRPARQYLALALASGDPAKTVVITHHGPHRRSLAPQFAEDLTSAAFLSDLSVLMGRSALWVHGHTHTSFDYNVRGSRVICNPRGYCSRDGARCENPAFRWDFLVDL